MGRKPSKTRTIMMRTLHHVAVVFAKRLESQHGAIRAYVREVSEIVKRETDADIAFGWVCRLMFAAVSLRDGAFTTEQKIEEIRASFESALPAVETMYIRLGFVTESEIRVAMKSERRAKRLVAYAMYNALGESRPALHVVRFNQGVMGLVVYAECIDGAWTIYHTPLENIIGAPRPKLRIETVSLRVHKPKVTPEIYRIESNVVTDAAHMRAIIALSVLTTDAPLNVPDPSAIASRSTSPVLFADYDNTQLDVYRDIAKWQAKRPYPRYGRTLLSLLRTWGVVGDEVTVDRALMDVIYKADENNDRVALTSQELTRLVETAHTEYTTHYPKPYTNQTNLKLVKCAQSSGTSISDTVAIDQQGAHVINGVLDAPTTGNIKSIFGLPAAEFASFVAIAEITTDPLKTRIEGARMDLTKVIGLRKEKETEEEKATTEGQDQKKEQTENEERQKLVKYWALVYRFLDTQSVNIHTCLDEYVAWYDKAFVNDSDVHVACDFRLCVGTVPVGAYIVASAKRKPSLFEEGAKHKVWKVYKKKSATVFAKGEFKEKDTRVTWSTSGAKIDEILKRKSSLWGPFYTEKEVLSSAGRGGITPILKSKQDDFRIECDRPNIEHEAVLTNAQVFQYDNWSNANYMKWMYDKAPTYQTTLTTLVGVAGAGLGYTGLAAALAPAAATAAVTGAVAAASGAIGLAGGVALSEAGRRSYNYIYGSANQANQQRVRDSKAKVYGAEMASAEIPFIEQTFDLGAFFLDTTSAMCSVALQNAHLAARFVSQP